jgi:predicted RNA-binding Zn-ribbon protein involved in translation (DUF1610 family)
MNDVEEAPDREMRCTDCGTRVFSSRAPALVASNHACPRCRGTMTIVPLPEARAFAYPSVRPWAPEPRERR